VTPELLTLGVLGSLVLAMLRSAVAEELKGYVQRYVTSRLEITLAALPPDLQAAWTEEWRAELAAIIAMPFSAALWVRGVRRSARRLVEDLALESAREMPGSERHAYLDDLIVKPWGHELRVYDDRWLDIWRLAIEPGTSTSTHAHVRKHTWLICIGGQAVLSTAAGEDITLVERSAVHISPGAVHATSTAQGADLLEIELPRDKLDLVRIADGYGRAGEPYEAADASRPEPSPLDRCPIGPREARLRRHCATDRFRFGLESTSQAQRNLDDLIVAVALDTSSVLRHDLILLGHDASSAVNGVQMYLTVRRSWR
jgi:hypothetical protein